MNFIDSLLNLVTMYRLTVYYLIALLLVALSGTLAGSFSFTPLALVLSTALIIAVCYASNTLLAKFFSVPTNTESFLITALILSLILTPTTDFFGLFFIGLISVIAMASKFVFNYHRIHLFNPAAIAVVITGIFFNEPATWWVGTTFMAPWVLVGGLLLTRKLQRFDLVLTFFLCACGITNLMALIKGSNILLITQDLFLHSSLLFLGFVMLTEPLTTPPTRKLRLLYGALVGLLFSPEIHIGSFAFAPEMTLSMGNLFSFLVSPKVKLKLFLKKHITFGSNTSDFVFTLPQKISFLPGQYLEWTLPHQHVDDRGNRRYFTIASSPTESELHLGVRFYENGSSYKKALQNLDEKTPILAGSLRGDFTLPIDTSRKLVFLAGGIGITPFRSMIKYLIDTNDKRDVTLFYANKTEDEIAYQDIFDDAEKKLGMKTVYTLTDEGQIPQEWSGEAGRISAEMIKKYVPDYHDHFFYLSGPHTMVTTYRHVLQTMGVSGAHIVEDFFPGFA